MTSTSAGSGAAGSELAEARRELDELTYAVAHDVRAPLRVIDGFSEALLEDYRDALTPGGIDYLLTIRGAVSRMEQLFDGIHELSRVSQAPVQHARVDVTAMAESIAAELVAGDPSRDVRFAIESNLEVRTDAALLHAALTHLLRNAWKFTAKRAAATITVGRQPQGSRALFVRDDGAGFDLAAAPRMFGPFQRFHPASDFEGLGLGLALVRRIVHRLGGRVHAESAPRKGTTIYMELP
ncbi:MAG TPA: ATP-binding protein [Thermoanaerobaculia bacterium]|nr:ATP-binding protein [Thermoanaerobaculia bacterium]